MKAVTLLSGGLDSTTLAYYLKSEGYDLITLSFDYGQRHEKELDVAYKLAEGNGWEHHTIGLRTIFRDEGIFYSRALGEILGPSVLVDPNTVVPDGHYASENMKQTVVPNRNAIMLSIAYAVALANNADLVAFGAHAGDHAIYPDCRPEFVEALETAFRLGASWTSGDFNDIPMLRGPFLFKTKADIAKLAYDLGVPIAETWSCYKGGDIHCGTCGTCYERREAFEQAGVPDPTPYLDSTTKFEAPA